MKQFTIEFRPAAAREFKKLPHTAKERLGEEIEKLAENPRPPSVKKMAGAENLWRVRVGDYRIIYEIQDARLIVLIVTIGHRREVYRKCT